MDSQESIVFLHYPGARREWERGKMDYKIFTEKIVDLLQDRMGAEYEVKTTDVTKNNDIQMTGVIMMRASDRISPTIYLEEPYRQYCEGVDMQEIVDRIVDFYGEQTREIDIDIDSFRDFEYVRDRIFHKIVNYDKNRKLLEDIPHFKWCDLAVVFYYAVEDSVWGNASILIHNNHMDMWEQTVDTLYRIAQSNMRKSMPELLLPMRELVEEMTGVKLDQTDEIRMYVLTNRAKLNGASALLYSDKIGKLADELQSDLLILPSSVHEVLLVPDDCEQQYDFFRQMVAEVNTTQVEPEEILSFSLYRYSRELAEIKEI